MQPTVSLAVGVHTKASAPPAPMLLSVHVQVIVDAVVGRSMKPLLQVNITSASTA